MEIYLSMQLDEMATEITSLPKNGAGSLDLIKNRITYGHQLVNHESIPKANTISDSHDFFYGNMMMGDGPGIAAITCNKSGECHHLAAFGVSKPTKDKPFDHTFQDETMRYRDSDLPKNYAQSVMYHHMEQTNLPLVTSGKQTPEGHALWRSFSKDAFDRGYHIYHLIDGVANRIKDHVALNAAVNQYWRKDNLGPVSHIVVSKSQIKELEG